ncbi:peptide ABC transporter permease [Dyella monticola]|uniref:Peptide ABC transporter permease n=1 Tax=Dyella monticola TaxID=1927958 RepID=A0A370X3W0_9GAMM|nr:FtsX-like permease family protein [Dyella monticola]RDS83026.1 peptide ABC transporter permease [Dyella monticola]
MSLHPILAALRKHKAGVVLIALQIALTLAIVCNAVFIIYSRVEKVNRPTGIDESNLLLITQQWVGAPSMDTPAGVQQLDSMLRQDLDTLRRMPDVMSVSSITSLPLLNSSWVGGVSLTPGAQTPGKNDIHTAMYFGDDQMVGTLGLQMVEGRNFNASEITNKGMRDQTEPSIVIVTQDLAKRLFPHGSAVGKVVYFDGGNAPSTIIGVVKRMQTPAVGWGDNFTWYSTLMPTRINATFSRYIVRTRPGQLDAVAHHVATALYNSNPLRVIDDDDGIKRFSDIRADAYRADIGMAVLMGVVCLILLAVTAAGIVGLTSFWVGQRHRQIGVRRALGARKIDILHYFQLENLMIAGAGALIGIALAVGLNRLLMSKFEMDSMPVYYVLVGLAVVMLLGQVAVFVPARRASNVPPVVATRSV